MISFDTAMRAMGWALLMAPIAMVTLLFARWNARRLRVRGYGVVAADRQLLNYRAGMCIGVLVFLGSLLPWVSLFLAVRFDWKPDDVSEIEIAQFPSPDPGAPAVRSVSVRSGRDLSRLLDGFKLLQPYQPPGHEHAVGKRYVVRLRRRSDGLWSGYRVEIDPDQEPAGGELRMRGVYEVSLKGGWGRLNLGRYQAPELGRVVDQLAGEPTSQ